MLIIFSYSDSDKDLGSGRVKIPPSKQQQQPPPPPMENGPSSGTDPLSNSDSKDVNIDFSHVQDTPSTGSKTKSDGHLHFNPSMGSSPYSRLEHPADKSVMLSFIGSVIFLVIALIVFCPIVTFIVLCLPIAVLVRQCMLCCCCAKPRRTCMCCCSPVVTHSDSVWLHDTHFNRTILQGLVTLEKGLDLLRIRDLIHAKLVAGEDARGRLLYPKMSQKVVPLSTGYMWERDENFNIEKHIYPLPARVKTKADLQEYIAEMSGQDLPRERPLWCIQVLEGFGEKKDTVVLIRVHQCMCDGISLLNVFLSSLVEEYSLFTSKPRYGRGTYLLNTLRAIAMGPLVFLQRWIFTRRDYNLIHASPRTGKKVVAWSEPFSFRKALRIKQVTRSTLNDVLLSAVAGSIRTYFQARGVGNPYNIQASIPVDLRTCANDVRMRTQTTFVGINLPTNTEGAIPRLWEIKQSMDQLKKSADSFVLYGAQWVLVHILPACLWRRILSSIRGNSTCVIANLPGPDSTIVFATRQVRTVLSLLPPPDEAALSISFLTYGEQLRMSVIADQGSVTDPIILAKDFVFQVRS